MFPTSNTGVLCRFTLARTLIALDEDRARAATLVAEALRAEAAGVASPMLRTEIETFKRDHGL